MAFSDRGGEGWVEKRGITKMKCSVVYRCTGGKAGCEEKTGLMRQTLPLKIMYYDFVEGIKGDKGQDENNQS